MPKHKLYLADAYSPLNSSTNEGSIPGNISNSLSTLHFVASSQGAQRDKSLINKSVSKKNMEKNKFSSKASDPSSATGCNIFDTVTPKSDSDSDVMEIDFFSTFNQKLPYSMEEDELIVEFVLKGQNIFKVSSLSLWKYLETKKVVLKNDYSLDGKTYHVRDVFSPFYAIVYNLKKLRKDHPKRTYHSLKNRFLRNIKPSLFTTYRHLIKDKETVNRILMKFPELKKQMGIKNTLSKINLPTSKNFRSSPLKVPEAKEQENRDIDKCQENTEGIKSARGLESDDVHNSLFRPSSVSGSIFRNNAGFYRKVKFGKKSIFVSVSLTDLDHSKAPVSLMKISERFEKLRTKRKRFFCPTCGNYNRHIREDDSSESDEESDIMIPNSVDESKKVPENLEKKFFNSDLKISQRTNHKIPFSENSCHNQGSQSLLNYDEIDELYEHFQGKDDDNCKESDASEFLLSGKKAIKFETTAKGIQDQEKPETVISKKEVAIEAKKLWDSDSEIDIIYENTIAGFRQLINADEEKMLFKKCLYRNRDSIGFNSDSEKNLDSYFLESSPEVETPALTENYSSLFQSGNSKTGSKSASNSYLAANMMKMLAEEKDKNKKS